MARIFTTSFDLGRSGNKTNLDDVILDVATWIENNNKKNIFRVDELEQLGTSNLNLVLGKNQVKSIVLSEDGKRSVGIEYQHEGEQEGDIWNTSLVFREDGDLITTSSRLNFSSDRFNVRPRRVHATKPSIINRLIDKYGAIDGMLPLPSKPLTIGKDHVQLYANYLLGTSDITRNFPVVFVSKRWDKEKTEEVNLIDTQILARKLSGIGSVVVEESKQFNLEMQKRNLIPKHLMCYGGAVRVYWKNSLNNYSDNELWTPQKIIELEDEGKNVGYQNLVEQSIFEYIVDVFNHTDLPRHLTFEGLAEKFAQQRIIEIRESLKSREKSEIESFETLKKDKEELIDLLRIGDSENELYRDQITELELSISRLNSQIGSQNFTIRGLEGKLSNCSSIADTSSIPEYLSIRDLTVGIMSIYNGKLIIPKEVLTSKDIKKSDEFKDYEFPFRALEWLATDYLSHLNNGGNEASHSSLNQSFKDFCSGAGFYSGHQSETTKNMHGGSYEIEFEGKTYPLIKHIGTGTAFNEYDKIIRIAFEPIRNEKTGKYNQVLVGYIGPHQENRGSK